jgi:hypothetical protein
MNDCTREWLNDLFGKGYHLSSGRETGNRITDAYAHISDTLRRRVTALGEGDELDTTDEDILTALAASMTEHNWNMLATTLFNKKEDE